MRGLLRDGWEGGAGARGKDVRRDAGQCWQDASAPRMPALPGEFGASYRLSMDKGIFIHKAQGTRNKARAAGTQLGFEEEKAGEIPSEIIGVSRDETTAIHRVCSDQDIGNGAFRE